MSDFLFDSLSAELNGIDAAPSTPRAPELGPGSYNVEATKAKLWEDDNSATISLLVQSVGGDFDGHERWLRFAVKTDKDWMRERDMRHLKQVMSAAGIQDLKSEDDLIGATFGIELKAKGQYVNLAKVYKSVPNPTTKDSVPAATAPAVEAPTENPFF